VGDGEAQHAAAEVLREGAVGVDPHQHVAALEAQVRVAGEGAGEQARLGEDLEAVADAQEQPAALDVAAHVGHDRGEAGDGAAAEVVAVGEAAGEHHEVGARGQRRGLVEDVGGLDPDHVTQRVQRVEIGVRSWELNHHRAHRRAPPPRKTGGTLVAPAAPAQAAPRNRCATRHRS
jgi:hypothetical protein